MALKNTKSRKKLRRKKQMNSQTLEFTANEQDLINTTGRQIFASDTVSYIEAVFSLGTNWTGFDSVRAVWKNGKYTISTLLDANGSCVVPVEVLTLEGNVRVNLVGSVVEDDELADRLTTFSVIALSVAQKVSITGSETAEVTPSQFEQYIETVSGIVEEAAEGAIEDAEAWAIGKRDGVDVPSTDETYHNNSKWYATQAGLSATSASQDASNASSSASAAAGSASSAASAKTAAETAQGLAEAAAEAAASVFSVVGNVTFTVLENGQVREIWTEEE